MAKADVVGAGMGRRTFLAGAGALSAASWLRLGRVRAEELPGCATPPSFPAGIELTKRRFQNWSGEVVVDEVWTATASTPDDVVVLANWARLHGHTIRATGHQHAFAPLTVTPEQTCGPVVLVDTTALSSLTLLAPDRLRAGAGASLEEILRFLDERGRGLSSVPAVGLITLGGMLAIGAHGAVVSTARRAPGPGDGYGSLSNQVQSITAVVWDEPSDAYVLRTFARPSLTLAALTTNLGRAFVTEVVLSVGAATKLRCRSILDQPATTVFAAPAAAGPHSFGALLERTGRVESILFPHTDNPWTKTWEVAPTKPAASKATTGPYNYTFSDSFPLEASVLVDQLVTGPGPHGSVGQDVLGGDELGALADAVLDGNAELTPVFGQTAYATSRAAVLALGVGDLWGPAFHTQLYIKATTLRFGQVGFVIQCARADVQAVAHRFYEKVVAMTAAYQAEGRHPINGPLEIRCSDVDQAADGSGPLLSALRPSAEHPGWNTALWVNLMTFPGTEGSYEFFTELEQWVRATFTAPLATARVEWSKAWAYTPDGPFTNPDMLEGGGIAGDYRATGHPHGWDAAVAELDALDPHRTFTNPFLERLGL